MLDIAKEREFIQGVDRQTRDLELQKDKLEQNKKMVEGQMTKIIEKMTEIGTTPNDISKKIESHKANIDALKQKMQSILGVKEDSDDEPSPF
jgi:chromosome segregation ATPase